MHAGHWCHENEASRPFDNCYDGGGRYSCPMCFPGGPYTEEDRCGGGSVDAACKAGCLPNTFPSITTKIHLSSVAPVGLVAQEIGAIHVAV